MIDKTYLPETIADQPLPVAGDLLIPAGAQTQSIPRDDAVLTPTEEQPRNFPERIIARETISSSLDTQSKRILGSFEFAGMGALQIGKYEFGVSGDVRITPSGITARDSNGITTFSLDGGTGDASFKGILSAGTIMAADSNIVMEAGSVGGRIVIYDSGTPVIVIGDPT